LFFFEIGLVTEAISLRKARKNKFEMLSIRRFLASNTRGRLGKIPEMKEKERPGSNPMWKTNLSGLLDRQTHADPREILQSFSTISEEYCRNESSKDIKKEVCFPLYSCQDLVDN